MLSKYWQHKLVAWLIVAGLIISLPIGVLAQSGEGDGNHLFLPAVQTDSVTFAQSDQEPAVPFVGNNHLFLPAVQTDLTNRVDVADNPSNDPCRTVAANATLTMGPGVSEVSSTSPSAAYRTVGCKFWVVDIRVPSNSSGTGSDLRSIAFVGDPAGPPNKAQCQSYNSHELYYKKAAGQTEFTQVAWRWFIGVWHEGNLLPCELYYLGGAGTIPRPNPPRNSTDVYRVAKAMEYGGKWRQVYVAAEHQSPAP